MNEYMKIADELAKDNLKTNVGGPFGACIVKDGKVIGKGSNHVLVNNDPTAHAEVMAIRDACKNINSYDLSDCELYTSCFPCPMCMSAIIWANIKKVYYGNTKEDAEMIGFRDKFIYEALSKINNNEDTSTIDLNCIDREETIKTFKDYMDKQDKTIY
ncbi:MAG: nucleoside deaminase [Bacilli bacterium]|nr:nucleoside deaminase [Bacilli bacterium]